MATKKEMPTKQTLIDLFDDNRNYTDIGRKFGVSRSLVKNWFKEYGLYSPPGGRVIEPPTLDELDKLIAGGMSNDGLAGRFQVHVTTVSLWLRTYGLLSKRARVKLRKMAEKVGEKKSKPVLKFPANECRNVPQFGALIEYANQSGGCYGSN